MTAGHAGDFINISSTKYADRSSSQREELEPDKLEVTVIPVDEEPYSKIITIPQSMIGKFDDDNPNLILIHLLSTTLHYHRFTFSIYGQENSTINNGLLFPVISTIFNKGQFYTLLPKFNVNRQFFLKFLSIKLAI